MIKGTFFPLVFLIADCIGFLPSDFDISFSFSFFGAMVAASFATTTAGARVPRCYGLACGISSDDSGSGRTNPC